MGRNKALLSFQGRPLIQRIVDEVSLVTNQVWISANKTDCYRFLKLPIIGDVYVGHGPLAGLHATMLQSKRPLVLLLACDLPEVRNPLLQRLVQCAAGYDAVIPQTSDGRFHPLCAVYRQTCLPVMERNLEKNRNKMTDLFETTDLRVRWLGGQEGDFHDIELRNLNTPEDLGTA